MTADEMLDRLPAECRGRASVSERGALIVSQWPERIEPEAFADLLSIDPDLVHDSGTVLIVYPPDYPIEPEWSKSDAQATARSSTDPA